MLQIDSLYLFVNAILHISMNGKGMRHFRLECPFFLKNQNNRSL